MALVTVMVPGKPMLTEDEALVVGELMGEVAAQLTDKFAGKLKEVITALRAELDQQSAAFTDRLDVIEKEHASQLQAQEKQHQQKIGNIQRLLTDTVAQQEGKILTILDRLKGIPEHLHIPDLLSQLQNDWRKRETLLRQQLSPLRLGRQLKKDLDPARHLQPMKEEIHRKQLELSHKQEQLVSLLPALRKDLQDTLDEKMDRKSHNLRQEVESKLLTMRSELDLPAITQGLQGETAKQLAQGKRELEGKLNTAVAGMQKELAALRQQLAAIDPETLITSLIEAIKSIPSNEVHFHAHPKHLRKQIIREDTEDKRIDVIDEKVIEE